MTLRTIESEFSELLQKESQLEFPLDLTLEGPGIAKVHPRVLWMKLQHIHNPHQNLPEIEVPGWFYECFENTTQASLKYPDINLMFEGKPWSVSQFLEGKNSQAIITFEGLGTVVLSSTPLEIKRNKQLHDFVLPTWLSYALSPELWGPQEKWPRFHQRLHDLFSKHGLLATNDSLGYYPLKSHAQKLAAHGFQGTNLDKVYLLVLPWTFSLRALQKLEEVILQEF